MAYALACGILAAPAPAAAQISQEQAAKDIEAQFRVEVLRVRPGTVGDTPVWLVTVMTRGGNFNDAFQVNTLAVDRDSGKLVRAYRRGPSGMSDSAVPPTLGIEQRPDAARSGTWR